MTSNWDLTAQVRTLEGVEVILARVRGGHARTARRGIACGGVDRPALWSQGVP